MKDFPGLPFASLPDVNSPDFVSRLRNMLGTIDSWGRDASVAFARLSNGQQPTGSGNAVYGGGQGGAQGAASSASGSTNQVRASSSSSNIMEWYDFSGSLLAFIDKDGVFHARLYFAENTPIVTLPQQATMSDTGAIAGAQLQIRPTSGASSVASIDTAGNAIFASINVGGTGATFVDTILLQDSGSGNVANVTWAGIGVSDTYVIPPGGGTVLTNSNTVAVTNKTLTTGNSIRVSAGANTTFQDASSTTKQMRFDLSGVTAANTRSQKWQDTAGSVVTVGNTASASGVLGTIALTAQTGSLGAQTLLTGNASSAGLYRVSFYLKTTTAGNPGDVVKATVSWNDGSAQSLDVPMESATVIFNNLDLGTLNAFAQGKLVVKAAASQNVTFTTTISKTGSPQYSIDARLESLG